MLKFKVGDLVIDTAGGCTGRTPILLIRYYDRGDMSIYDILVGDEKNKWFASYIDCNCEKLT